MKKKLFIILGCCLFLLSGCADKEVSIVEDTATYIYYINVEESKIEQEEYVREEKNSQELIADLCNKLSEQPENLLYLPLLPTTVVVEDWELIEGTLWLNLSEGYRKLEKPREILTRAGIVRTFCQVDEVKGVGIKIAGDELEDAEEKAIGVMTPESFIESSGKEVNAYQYVTMSLYFANKNGDKLIKEQRKIYYSKNTPLERVVVEQLLKGSNSGGYPVMPSETKILGVSVLDGIGYVNLDNAFNDMALPLKEDMAIQAIVNSLVETCNVEKVQISINGESKIEFRDSISLDQLFEMNEHFKVEEKDD